MWLLVSGRIFKDDSGEAINPHLPLETFTVAAGNRYRFRVISAAMTYSLRLSIDHHDLHVVASDGSDVQPVIVDSIVINSGERYDFWIQAKETLLGGNYWIRAETLERYQSGQVSVISLHACPPTLPSNPADQRSTSFI